MPPLGNNQTEIIANIRVREGSWYEQIPKAAAHDIGNEISKLSAFTQPTLFFCGLNELGISGLEAILQGLANFEQEDRPDVFFIEYQPSLLKSAKERNSILNKISKRARSVTLFVLDKDSHASLVEAIPDEYYSRNIRIDWLPDPPPFEPGSRLENVGTCKWIQNRKHTNSSPAVLAVGKQSPRKGITDIVRAVRLLEIQKRIESPLNMFVSGSLDLGIQRNEEISKQLLRLQSICWRRDYVDDCEILQTYASSDYVLLPYDTSFEGSSGVFAYATALGKPIISTGHGCIGGRVTKYGLGFTYRSGDYEELANILANLKDISQVEYTEMSKRCQIYSTIFSTFLFKSCLVKKVCRNTEQLICKTSQTANPIKRHDSPPTQIDPPSIATPLCFS